jgi:hypothetical protein
LPLVSLFEIGKQFSGNVMTAEQITLGLFTIFNLLRILGYFPQIVCSIRDRSGGASTSMLTWFTFFGANASAAAYAALNVADWLMALMFFVNALCCAVVTFVTLWKRVAIAQEGRQLRDA